jgi:hypothetical protein
MTTYSTDFDVQKLCCGLRKGHSCLIFYEVCLPKAPTFAGYCVKHTGVTIVKSDQFRENFSFGFANPKDKWGFVKALFFPVAGAVTLDDPILDNTLNHKRNSFKRLRIAKIAKNIPDAGVNEAKKVAHYGTRYSILASLVPNTHNCQTSVARFRCISKVELGAG